MKKIFYISLLFMLVGGGCASTSKKNNDLYIASPADAATAYISGVLSKDSSYNKKVYSLLSAGTRNILSYNEFKSLKTKDTALTGRKITKSTLLNAAEVAAGRVIVYILYLTEDPENIGWKHLVVMRLYTVFEDGSFKVFLREDDSASIDIMPVFLQMKKNFIKPDTMKLLYSLVKEDIYEHMPKEYQMRRAAKKNVDVKQDKSLDTVSAISESLQKTVVKKISPLSAECIRRGRALFAEENYRGALMQFEKAYAIDNNAKEAKQYIALCKEKL